MRREVAVLNRAMEFFTEKDLAVRMGGPKEKWPEILLKELIDNAVDAAEGGTAPVVVNVAVAPDGFTVCDNGPGIPETVIRGSLDYNVRVSDKSLYCTPTRGQQGNALKCVWAAPFVAHGGKAAVKVTVAGNQYTVNVSADQINGTPEVTLAVENGRPVKNGTLVEVGWPDVACYGDKDRALDFYRLIWGFAALNPHVTFLYQAGDFEADTSAATDVGWKKWLPSWRPPPHWYNLDRFTSLVGGKLAAIRRSGGRPPRLRDFIAENFCGLKSTSDRAELLRGLGLEGCTLEDLAEGNALDGYRLGRLLSAMREYARPVKPKTLGLIGRRHLTETLIGRYEADERSVRYATETVVVDDLPYVLEVAFGFSCDEDYVLDEVYGVNWSPSVVRPPFSELKWALGDCGVDDEDPCTLIAHLACPRPEFVDSGKTVLSLPAEVSEALCRCVENVTAPWKKAKRKAERLDARRKRLEQREIDDALRQKKQQAGFLSIKAACWKVMEEAYQRASGNGQYPAEARQIMYAARRLVLTGKLTDQSRKNGGFYKNSSSFTQDVLPDFTEKNPELAKDWDVVFDDRGHFTEPHTHKHIGLGTVAVRDYLGSWEEDLPEPGLAYSVPWEVKTCGPANRYRFALFVEKEGFDSLLESARIQERFDVALMSTKGMSVTAARQLVEWLSRAGVTILVLHDFDKYGVSILHTLRSSTRRYKFKKKPRVIDLGLRLEDVKELGLDGEPVIYATKVNPRVCLRRSGASAAECKFLVSGGGEGKWEGKRVELNEMTSPQFVEYLERKLTEVGAKKVVPEGDALKDAYHLQLKKAKFQLAVEAATKGIGTEAAEVPDSLGERLEKMIEGKSDPWDKALWEVACEGAKAGQAFQGGSGI
jgi:hypothetical protein